MSEKEFKELNNQYINCMNDNYDLFFEGKSIEINNDSCKEILDKMKKFSFYKDLEKEFVEYQKANKSNS